MKYNNIVITNNAACLVLEGKSVTFAISLQGFLKEFRHIKDYKKKRIELYLNDIAVF